MSEVIRHRCYQPSQCIFPSLRSLRCAGFSLLFSDLNGDISMFGSDVTVSPKMGAPYHAGIGSTCSKTQDYRSIRFIPESIALMLILFTLPKMYYFSRLHRDAISQTSDSNVSAPKKKSVSSFVIRHYLLHCVNEALCHFLSLVINKVPYSKLIRIIWHKK